VLLPASIQAFWSRTFTIRYVDLETYRNHLRQKPTKNGGMRTVASVNREISCLHHLFTKAVEWEMIERSPFDKGKSLLMKENNKRFRYLDEHEIGRLLNACINVHTKDIIETVIHTGMRRQEVLGLKWEQMRGGTIKELQEILDHKTVAMTMRYAHLSQEHKKKAINRLNGLTASGNGNCHKTVTSLKSSVTAIS
jgi:integrase